MEVLLVIACTLAWASGAQSEQTKLGLSKAQRDQIRENVRHEKAVRKIAEKHGIAPAEMAPEAVPAEAPVPAGAPATLPEAFRSGYRSHTPVARVATPLGRHAGSWAARGVVWVKDSGKSALREYRKRRQAAGHEDPAPVLVPLPPAHPPAVPPMPAHPPAVPGPPPADTEECSGVSLKKPDPPAGPEGPSGAPGGPSEALPDPSASKAAPEPPSGSEKAAEPVTGALEPTVPGPRPAPDSVTERDTREGETSQPEAEKSDTAPAGTGTEPVTPQAAADTEPGTPQAAEPTTDTATPKPPDTDEPTPDTPGPETDTAPDPEPETVTPADTDEPRPATAGVPDEPPQAADGTPGPTTTGQAVTAPTAGGEAMAAEVNYESVMEESDELTGMCEGDRIVYQKLINRCRREQSKGDELYAELDDRGVGQWICQIVARCKERYSSLAEHLTLLDRDTLAQGEAVQKAKGYLEAGQGLYADIARDMEDVADRDYYTSDRVDDEDVNAHTETYEMRGAGA
ncbi:hypothetical protein B591_31013 (plasmid) [Streptomyces sp. GBA 94-10 4N24]|uniref:hypothetical protein n=1 Tax=Streptomyces sp. GBA 94-10 4N24 TaxID=1218177 RepID=UPI0003C31EF0|nr:hypothetical protein [Streptomyces sp. GBA 94-10 4N24]ESP95722.1 hypothetical protein B591_31013 [Streptomyces sp. GBA 94-10 4N24]UZN63182.1 hypothetical protein B591N_31013 [Streptomyces sp. GBA 94-10 4N24]